MMWYVFYCVWILITYIVLWQGEYKHILILNIDGQNIIYVFASKDTHATYFEFKSSIRLKCSTYSNNVLEEQGDYR